MTDSDTKDTDYTHRILVIDDEPRIRTGCRDTLSFEGYDITLADSGMLGMQLISERHFDIILLDLMMPGMNGFEVLSKVKTLHPDTVVIIITGYATIEHTISAMKKGAFDFIPKPFSPDQLRIAVLKAIDHNRALHDIANERTRMRVLIDYIGDGVLTTDRDKNIVLANPTFLKMIGYPSGDVTGRHISEIFENEIMEGVIEKALMVPPEEMTSITEEWRTENDRVIAVRGVPFRDRRLRTIGTVTVLKDITEITRINQMKSEFVSMVSHEIRSPMNSILAQLKVIRDGLAGEVTPKQNEMLKRVSERISALSDMTSELLDLAKIESGLMVQEKEAFDIGPVISDQVEMYRERAREKGIEMEWTPPGPLPEILANRVNIGEVFSNIIGNAVRYTPEKGAITISISRDDNYLCVKVADTGIGIEENELAHIFDPFYRVKNEKTRHIAGTGLGLSIVKKILDAHDGRIHIESIYGKGSAFFIYLPQNKPH